MAQFPDLPRPNATLSELIRAGRAGASSSGVAGAHAVGSAFARYNLQFLTPWLVDAKIREQIQARVFPIRLKAEDWTSGETTWLLDVIAPSQKVATAVLASFKQVVKDKPVRIHPLVSQLVDPAVLEKMKVRPVGEADSKTEGV
jgi:hypothetical protein